MDTSSIYRSVINNVVKKIENELDAEGVSKQVLKELHMTWERRLIESGALPIKSDIKEATSSSTETRGRPKKINKNLSSEMYNEQELGLLENHSLYTTNPLFDNITGNENKGDLNSNDSKTQLIGKPTKELKDNVLTSVELSINESRKRPNMNISGSIKQETKKPKNTILETLPKKTQENNKKIEQNENNLLEINEELSSESEDDEDLETDNLLLCQYEKVGRSKNRWKVSLKSVVAKINGKDYIFNNLLGDFQW